MPLHKLKAGGTVKCCRSGEYHAQPLSQVVQAIAMVMSGNRVHCSCPPPPSKHTNSAFIVQGEWKKTVVGMCTMNPTEASKPRHTYNKAHLILKPVFCNDL